jgi:hypothetical protein
MWQNTNDEWDIKTAARKFVETGDQLIRLIIREREESARRVQLLQKVDRDLEAKAAADLAEFLAAEQAEKNASDALDAEMGLEPLLEVPASAIGSS